MSSNDDRYFKVMLEEMRGNFKVIMEAFADLRQKLDDKPTREEFNNWVGEIKAIKLAVKETNKDVKNHEVRITRLEKAV